MFYEFAPKLRTPHKNFYLMKDWSDDLASYRDALREFPTAISVKKRPLEPSPAPLRLPT